MGKSPVTEYVEVWSMFAEIIERGRSTGRATRHKDQQLFLHRRGYLEECYVTYTFVPILGDNKQVVGFYHTAVETTSQVLSLRRNQTLLAFGEAVKASRSLNDYWQNLLQALETHNQDLPWALAYSFAHPDGYESLSDTDSGSSMANVRAPSNCTLAGVTGRAMGQVPFKFDRKNEDDPFVRLIKKSISSGETIVLDRTDSSLPAWVFDGGQEKAENDSLTALLIPISPTARNDADGQSVIGFLVAGISRKREYDHEYAAFVQLCSRQLATSAASVLLLEQEISRQVELAEQLSISARQTLDLEQKLSKFSEISNIGMCVIFTP
jgi:hypothetical protein